MTTNKIKKIVLIISIIICLVGIIYSLYKILIWKANVDENETIRKKTEDSIKIIEPNDQKKEEVKYEIDFKTLKEENSDTVGYIKVNNTNINYVVVKGTDNKFYLNHNFNKKYNVAGWIFADYHNKFDGTDKNIIIYGHNTHNGSMFNTLANSLKKEWYTNKENHIITLVTEYGTQYYEVFSTYSIVPEDYYIKTEFNDDEFANFIQNIKMRSFYDYGVSLTNIDKILTLSSCIGNHGEKRVVLHAKLIEQ